MAFSQLPARCTACNMPHGEPKDKLCPEIATDDASNLKKDGVNLSDIRVIAGRLLALEEQARVNALKLKKDSSSSSDSSGSESDDYSSTSAYSNGRRQARSQRRARRHRGRHQRRSDSRALKSSRYSHHRHLGKGEVVKTFEKLMSVNLRVLSDLQRRGEGAAEFAAHLTLLADKAETKFYRNENLISYDKAVRVSAAKEGYVKFGFVDSTLVMTHLGFDAAVSQRRPSAAPNSSTARPKKDAFCYRFNGGVPCDANRCPFRHICGNCGDSTHQQPNCKKPKQGPVPSTQGAK